MIKLIKRILTGTGFFCALLTLAFNASAEEYIFRGVEEADFYPTTAYEDVYGAQYRYGGPNVSDFDYPELDYGKVSNTSIGAMEKHYSPEISSYGGTGIDYGLSSSMFGRTGTVQEPTATPVIISKPTAYTSVEGMARSDGSIGTVSIPALNINMKVWEGETTESMAKGMAHYASTSGWNGNVGVCGHNRGARYVIGGIKDLKSGDLITYETVYGSRTYEVSYVGTISNMDWSRLQATSDNRITITTCLAGQPEYRVCVQAVEKILKV